MLSIFFVDRLYKKTIGFPIIADDVKAPVGIVRDFIVDTDNGKILAFLINKRRNLVIIDRDISGFEFFPRVKSQDCIIEGDEVIKVKKAQKKGFYIISNKVFTEKGKFLGICEDFLFDDNHFVIKKLFVLKKFLFFFTLDKRIISIENLVEIKKDKIIVKEDLITEKQHSMVGVA